MLGVKKGSGYRLLGNTIYSTDHFGMQKGLLAAGIKNCMFLRMFLNYAEQIWDILTMMTVFSFKNSILLFILEFLTMCLFIEQKDYMDTSPLIIVA